MISNCFALYAFFACIYLVLSFLYSVLVKHVYFIVIANKHFEILTLINWKTYRKFFAIAYKIMLPQNVVEYII